MTTDTTRIVAALRRLAEAEEACPGDNTIHKGCFVCNRTGRVPLFCDTEGKALFRVNCHGNDDARPWSRKVEPPGICRPEKPRRDCSWCRGLGWLPLDVGEIHLEMLLLLAINNEHESLAGGQLFQTMMSALGAKAHSAKTEQDLVEAVLMALDAAMEARA